MINALIMKIEGFINLPTPILPVDHSIILNTSCVHVIHLSGHNLRAYSLYTCKSGIGQPFVNNIGSAIFYKELAMSDQFTCYWIIPLQYGTDVLLNRTLAVAEMPPGQV